MRVAIVDDEKEILEKINSIIKQFADDNSISIDIDCFMDETLLLMDIGEGKNYDVYFLDIELQQIDGITLAKRLREKQIDVYIVFITGHMKYALEGYDVKAYQYILKNQIEEKLFKTINLIYDDFIKNQEKYFIIQTNSRYEKILYQDIYYIYKEHKNSIFVTKHGITQIRMTLQEVYTNLNHNEFIYIDRGYIVNIRYIKKFQNQEIILVNHESLPVSKPHMREVKAEIGRYWKDRV